MNELNELGNIIFLDRYAKKDLDRDFKIGDIVVFKEGYSKKFGTIVSLDNNITILSDNETFVRGRLEIDRVIETTPEQMFKRVAEFGASVEKDRETWTQKFIDLTNNWKFVPAGRILAGAGINGLSAYNCVSGETLIHTKQGLVQAKTLVDKTVETLSKDGKYREAKWGSYGKQRLWDIVLSNGDVLHATEEHEWVVPKNGEYIRIKTCNLAGKHIPVQHEEFVVEQNEPFLKGVQHGYVYGDGTIANHHTNVPAFTEQGKEFVKQYFNKVTYQPSRDAVVAHGLPENYKTLPNISESIDYLRGFIAGLIAADGHVDKRGSVMLHSANLQELIKIRRIAAECGIPVISIKLIREINPFNGEVAPCYKMQFVKAAFRNSGMILLSTHLDNMNQSSKSGKKQTIKVVDVYPTNRYEEVFCCVEPETHTMVIEGGYLTGQCFVISSPKDSRNGITNTLEEMIEIMSRGGGVGINLSSLRPRNAVVKGVNGRSSGAVSWGGIYSYATGLIEQGGCVSGDTLIPTANGTHKIKDLVGTRPWVYSYNLETNTVVAKQAKWVDKTGHKKTLTIKTDKGLSLTLTYDHKVLMRDGQYIEAGKLKVGQRIMPLQRKVSRKEIVVSTILGDNSKKSVYKGQMPLHRFFYLNTKGDIYAGTHIHHIDGNHYNNEPNNLVQLPHSEHAKLHAKKDAFVEFNTTLTDEQKKERSAVGANGFIEKWNNRDEGFYQKVAHKALNDNPMKDYSLKVKNAKSSAIGTAYKLINAGFDISSSDKWDKALFDNRITKTGEKFGLGITNLVPRSEKISNLFGSFDSFYEEIGALNHKIVSIQEFVEMDVYDMEVPDTNNFAVALGVQDSDGGVFIHNSRRGALMLMLADWHPDIEEFIDSKREAGKITNANISVTISDKFMQAVKEGKDWVLAFPDTMDEHYANEWNGDLQAWLEKGYSTILYKSVKAKELYQKIIESAWASAEPGIAFIDRANNMSNSQYFDRLIATNPCAEQWLPAGGVCNLGAINLAKYVNQDGVTWDDLYSDVQTAVRFLDDVIDATPYFFELNKTQQMKERRVGLNTMGLAEMLIKLGLKYGSDGSIQFINKLYKHIVKAAYEASSLIAKEKGSFPAFDYDKFIQSGYMKNMLKEIPELLNIIKENGLRNVTLLTQAPNGSISTMIDTSSGIEPFFAFEYQRTSRLGKYTQKVKILEDWIKAHPNKEIPDYFITAMDLTPREHVEILAAIQYWIDSSISKTCNVPNEYTVEQVAELYHLMYDLGAKGGTIYRDGSRDAQVLEVVKKDEALKENQIRNPVDEKTMVESGFENLPASNAPISNIRTGQTISLPTGFGTLHLTCNFDEQNEPVEVFINVGKAGTDLMAIAEGIGRLISYSLQMPSNLSREERYTAIISQLRGIGGNTQSGFGPNKIVSFPDAISRAMTFETTKVNKNQNKVSMDLCPECKSVSLVREEGCSKCSNCGYSKC